MGQELVAPHTFVHPSKGANTIPLDDTLAECPTRERQAFHCSSDIIDVLHFLALLPLQGMFFVEEPPIEVLHAVIVVSTSCCLPCLSSSSRCCLPCCHLPCCLPSHLPPAMPLLHHVSPMSGASDFLSGPCQLAMFLQ